MAFANIEKLEKLINNHHYRIVDKYNSEDWGMFTTGILQVIKESEVSDAVEVVRCKNCKNRRKIPKEWRELYPESYISCVYHGVDLIMEPDGFCSDGVREELDNG